MTRKTRNVLEYRGRLVFRCTIPGYRLKWSSGRLAADTLAGIKALIRDEVTHDAR